MTGDRRPKVFLLRLFISTDNIPNEWSIAIGVDAKDICITFVKGFHQSGQKYPALINLYLPSLWLEQSIQNIQTELLNLFVKQMNIHHDQVFIITSFVQSEHMAEHGNMMI